jgi:dTDP-4-dehydrorhamnose reductase
MTLWLLGANGLVGSAFRSTVSCLTSGHEVDISDLAALRAFVKNFPGITHIVNAAAFTQVDPAEIHKEEAFRTNVLGPENLGVIATEIGASLLHLSTDYVFPGNGNRPLRETDPTGPCNYYGQTKLEGEQRLMAVYPQSTILRVSWVFGRGGKNFVSQLFSNLQTKPELQIVCDQWSRYTYAPDLVKVMWQLLGKSGLYQFANAGAATKYEFALAMKEQAEKKGVRIATQRIIPVSHEQFPAACQRPLYSVFDTSKVEQSLGLRIRSWKEALSDHLEDLLVS